MQNLKPHLILIDGLGLLFRSFYAMRNMANNIGQNIGGIYGFVNQLRKIILEHITSHVVIAFDTGQKTWRHKAMPEYKANRKASPPELRHQFQWARDACIAMNVEYTECIGYEADDIIATYVKEYEHDFDVLIVSIDKDLMQLVKSNVIMYDPFKKIYIDENWVNKKFSVCTYQIVDFLSLIGDASDGIPGVTGIGPKTAAKWLATHHNIDNIAQNLDILTPRRLAENFKNEQSILHKARNMITLKTDINIPKLKLNKYNLNNIDIFFSEIGIMQNKLRIQV